MEIWRLWCMQLFPANAKVGCSSTSEPVRNLGDNLSVLFTQFSACTALECNVSIVLKEKPILPSPLSLRTNVLKLNEAPLLKGVGAYSSAADTALHKVYQNIRRISREMEALAHAGPWYPQMLTLMALLHIQGAYLQFVPLKAPASLT